MKKVAILLVALTSLYMVSGMASAADMKNAEDPAYCGATKATPSVTTESGQVCEVLTIEGKVDQITPPNPAATDKRTMITIIDKKGERTVFAVTPETALCGVDMSPITLESIKEGMPVKVKGYCAKEGEGVAQSIILAP